MRAEEEHKELRTQAELRGKAYLMLLKILFAMLLHYNLCVRILGQISIYSYRKYVIIINYA
jgi:hypothetical protein